MINYAGSVQSYVKSLDMQWKAKKKFDEMSGKKTSPFAMAALPSFAEGIKVSSTNDLKLNGINVEEVDYRLSQIVVRLKQGKKLTNSELDYLRKKDPALHAKALRIQDERDKYELELKRCRTKEEVRRTNLVRNQLLLGEVKKAAASGDLEAATDLEMRANSIKDAHETFVNSRRYEKLPENQRELDKRRVQAGRRPTGVKMPDEEREDLAPSDGEKQETELLVEENASAEETLLESAEDAETLIPDEETGISDTEQKNKKRSGERGNAGRKN